MFYRIFSKSNNVSKNRYIFEYYQIDQSTLISLEEIRANNKYVDELISLSNDIIKYNLLSDIKF